MMQPRAPRGFNSFFAFIAAWTVIGLAVWAVIIFVIIHFILKFW
jgi:hypothetical protein